MIPGNSHLSRSGAIVLIAGGIFGATSPSAAQTDGPIVRMGAMAFDGGGEAYYGADYGVWANNGIVPQITTAQSGQVIIQGVLSGELDVGIANPFSIATAIARNIPIVMIAPAVVYSSKDSTPNLVVAKNGSIKSPKDLIGATFGVTTLSDLSQLSLLAWLERNNIPRDGVKFVELTFGEVGVALTKNVIQAAIIIEPFRSAAIAAGQIHDIGDTLLAMAPEISPMAWFTTRTWLKNNRDLAKRLVKAIYATAAFTNNHPKETGDTLARITKTEPAVMASLKRLIFATSNERRYTEPILSFAAEYKMIARPVTFEEFSPPI
jgi:NitT/TauT family transport system substrate-binding protein